MLWFESVSCSQEVHVAKYDLRKPGGLWRRGIQSGIVSNSKYKCLHKCAEQLPLFMSDIPRVALIQEMLHYAYTCIHICLYAFVPQ